MTRHEIHVLRAVGMAQAAVAAKAGVSKASVRRIERKAPVTTSEPRVLVQQHRVGRPSIATPWAATIEGWLAEDGALPSGEVVRRLREEHGYAGGQSAVYELVRRLRPVTMAPLVRFEGVAGEFSQPDFGQIGVRSTAGGRERIHFFASRLKWSRFAHVSVVPDEQEETLIRALLVAFEAFGGVPLVTVWDNPTTVVLSRKGDLIVWNPIFGQVALDYRFAPSCAGRGPRSRRAPSRISSAGSRRASSAAGAFTTGPTSRASSRSGSPARTRSGPIGPPARSRSRACPRSALACGRCRSRPPPTR